MYNRSKISVIIKVIAFLTMIIGIMAVSNSALSIGLGFLVIAISIIIGILIFGFGEIINILNDIRNKAGSN
ncbi:MAG TPA: hypothetical protein VHT96_02970 [Clostridia bacterium]|nr:hypothetical protein [Clostridia bacterium]